MSDEFNNKVIMELFEYERLLGIEKALKDNAIFIQTYWTNYEVLVSESFKDNIITLKNELDISFKKEIKYLTKRNEELNKKYEKLKNKWYVKLFYRE